jgi:flagellin-like hook-associated protein FlgL
VFSDLQSLISSLQSGTQGQITAAAGALQTDSNRVVSARGVVGSQEQSIQGQISRLADEDVATKSLLSNLQDTDFATTVTQYQTLQTSLQGTLEVAAKSQHLAMINMFGLNTTNRRRARKNPPRRAEAARSAARR